MNLASAAEQFTFVKRVGYCDQHKQKGQLGRTRVADANSGVPCRRAAGFRPSWAPCAAAGGRPCTERGRGHKRVSPSKHEVRAAGNSRQTLKARGSLRSAHMLEANFHTACIFLVSTCDHSRITRQQRSDCDSPTRDWLGTSSAPSDSPCARGTAAQ